MSDPENVPDNDESDSSFEGNDDIVIVREWPLRLIEGEEGSEMEEGSEVEEGAETEGGNEQFDISLPATHSYLPELVSVPGSSVLESGWCGRIFCLQHHSIVYPNETVPIVFSNPEVCEILAEVIRANRLFGLTFPKSTEAEQTSGYGVLCEVFEATQPQVRGSLAVKARARQRFKCLHARRAHFSEVQQLDITILPEIVMRDPMLHCRLSSLDNHRSTTSKQKLSKIRRMDTAVTSWPPFVYDNCSHEILIRTIRSYFSQLKFESLPSDVVSVSFWAASNLPLSYRDRLKLFKEDNALQRLRMEAKFVEEYYVLCCQGCQTPTEIAKREHIFAMSSEGMKSNYCNLGGYMHDIMTVSEVTNVRTNGAASAEFSWFPGYLWTILVCKHCGSHIGWRFSATKRSFQRQKFYAICRNYVYPYNPADAPEL